MKYQDKDVIVREGTEGNTFYIILKGEVVEWTLLLHNILECVCVCVCPVKFIALWDKTVYTLK